MELRPKAVQAGDDAIDWFADALRRHPDRADDLKHALRGRLNLNVRARNEARRELAEEPDDFWDNVPV